MIHPAVALFVAPGPDGHIEHGRPLRDLSFPPADLTFPGRFLAFWANKLVKLSDVFVTQTCRMLFGQMDATGSINYFRNIATFVCCLISFFFFFREFLLGYDDIFGTLREKAKLQNSTS